MVAARDEWRPSRGNSIENCTAGNAQKLITIAIANTQWADTHTICGATCALVPVPAPARALMPAVVMLGDAPAIRARMAVPTCAAFTHAPVATMYLCDSGILRRVECYSACGRAGGCRI